MPDVDVREIVDCSCMRMRRTTRRVTQIYDHLLQPAGLTVNQFGLLGQLYGAAIGGAGGLSIGALALRMGMDPTTLNRNLKPLEAQGLVADVRDPQDRRVRSMLITAKGCDTLRRAVPFWREAQAKLAQALGAQAMRALNDLLDLSIAKLAPST